MRIDMIARGTDGQEITTAQRHGKTVPLGYGLASLGDASSRAHRLLDAGAASVSWHDEDDMIDTDDGLSLPREINHLEKVRN